MSSGWFCQRCFLGSRSFSLVVARLRQAPVIQYFSSLEDNELFFKQNKNQNYLTPQAYLCHFIFLLFEQKIKSNGVNKCIVFYLAGNLAKKEVMNQVKVAQKQYIVLYFFVDGNFIFSVSTL